jgi:hypothetical protein
VLFLFFLFFFLLVVTSCSSTGPASPFHEFCSTGDASPDTIYTTSSTGHHVAPYQPTTCTPVPPNSDGITIPMYLIDMHTAGTEWNVDFYMTQGFRVREKGKKK